MANENAKTDDNRRKTLLGVTDNVAAEVRRLLVDPTTGRLKVSATVTGSGGEANTASNVGAGGVGIFKQKTGVDLELKNINAGSSKITVTDDAGNDEVDIDVAEANLTLSNLGGTLSTAKGGTNNTTFTASQLIVADGAGTTLESSGKTVPTGDIVGTTDSQALTNKTLDASLNTVSNIAVSHLANGTDGQLITWDAAGAPAVVAVGNATEVLTSNGAGAAPTFQPASGGTLSVAKGGTNNTTFTASQLVVADGAGTTLQSSGKVAPSGAIVGDTDAQALTNKTIDSASNTISNIAIADLANGTDGEMITWSAAGTAAAVAAGNATEVLTSNGAGAAPTFQPASGGTSDKSFSIEVLPLDIITATGDDQARILVPSTMNGMNLTGVAASVGVAGTTGTLDIQIRNVTDTADMLSTKLTIDSGELNSGTAATPAVINAATDDVATYDIIAIDIDAVHTTPAEGLIVNLIFETP